MYYLQLTGVVIYHSDPRSELHKYIFHNPHWILSVFGHVFNHNFHDNCTKFDSDNRKAFAGYSNNTRKIWHRYLKENGLMKDELLKCLVYKFNLDESMFEAVMLLLQKFDICYVVLIEKDTFLPAGCYYRFPSLLPKDQLGIVETEWPEKCPRGFKEFQLVQQFVHPMLPCGLFEKISVRINGFLDHRFDWRTGILGFCNNSQGKILITCIKDENDRQLNIKFATRVEEGNQVDARSNLMTLYLCSQECCRHYPGVASWWHHVCAHCLKMSVQNPHTFEIQHIFLSQEPPLTVRCINSIGMLAIEEVAPVRKSDVCSVPNSQIKKNLEARRCDLVKDIDISSGLLNELRSLSVITCYVEEELKAGGASESKQKERLLDRLLKRPLNDMAKFCQALEKTNQMHIVTILESGHQYNEEDEDIGVSPSKRPKMQ